MKYKDQFIAGFNRGAIQGLIVAAWLMLIALAFLAMTGCAVNSPVLTETIGTTNGIVTTKSLRMTSFAVWPATTTVDKQRGSVGKTLSVGTEGAELETSNTNAAATLRELRLLLESLR